MASYCSSVQVGRHAMRAGKLEACQVLLAHAFNVPDDLACLPTSTLLQHDPLPQVKGLQIQRQHAAWHQQDSTQR